MSLMPLSDFLEHSHSVFRQSKELGGYFRAIPDLRESHIFYLGEDGDYHKGVKAVVKDLMQEMADGVPMPFKDISCVSIVRNEDAALEGESAAQGEPCWTFDRVIQDPSWMKEVIDKKEPECPPEALCVDGGSFKVDPELYPIRQRFVVCRYQMIDRIRRLPRPMVWAVYYRGILGDGMFFDSTYPNDLLPFVRSSRLGVDGWITYETGMILEQIAAISHPVNYIVRVAPEMTPREHRRTEKSGQRPDKKREHYIVVDHDVLVGMSKGHFGTHASPVPHERRGHWRRLAERCTLAHARGQSRTFVRPTYIGDREFSDGKNRYQVLMSVDEQREVQTP